MHATVKIRSIAEPQAVVRVVASLRAHPARSAARSPVRFTRRKQLVGVFEYEVGDKCRARVAVTIAVRDFSHHDYPR
jgi:hypothetical protein